MYGRDAALDLARRALSACDADEVQAVVRATRTEETAYGSHRGIGHSRREAESLHLRVRVNGCEAFGSTTRSDVESVARLARSLSSAARVSDGRDPLAPLPGPQHYPPVEPYNATTALWTPGQRAESARLILEQAHIAGLSVSGRHSTGVAEVAVVNSAGLEAYEARTAATLLAEARSPSGVTGYGDGHVRDAAQLNPFEIGEQAVAKAGVPGPSAPLEAGEYAIVLEQNAVGDLLRCLAPSFGAGAVRERHSFLTDTLGRELTGPLVSITEDPLSPDGLHSAFDAEGMPRRRVELIRAGVAVSPVSDLRAASSGGPASTGNAVLDPCAGPRPRSLFMDHADAEMEALIGAVERGILVTRFRDLLLTDPVSGAVLGHTDGGTFLIESGVITRPLSPVRFEQSILALFRQIALVSRERKLIVYPDGLHVVAPALMLRGIHMDGA